MSLWNMHNEHTTPAQLPDAGSVPKAREPSGDHPLTPRARQQLLDLQRSLLGTVIDLSNRSLLQRLHMAEEDLQRLPEVAAPMNKTAKKTRETMRAIRLGTDAIAFAGAIMLGQVAAILTGS